MPPETQGEYPIPWVLPPLRNTLTGLVIHSHKKHSVSSCYGQGLSVGGVPVNKADWVPALEGLALRCTSVCWGWGGDIRPIDKYRALLWTRHTLEDWGLSPVHTEPLTSWLLSTSGCHLSWLITSQSSQFTHSHKEILFHSLNMPRLLSPAFVLCTCGFFCMDTFLEKSSSLHSASLSSGKTSYLSLPDVPALSSNQALWPPLISAASGHKHYEDGLCHARHCAHDLTQVWALTHHSSLSVHRSLWWKHEVLKVEWILYSRS